MTNLNERVKKRRDRLRAAGLRPVQIWLPDTRRPGFAEECARQSARIAEIDRKDSDLLRFLDDSLADILVASDE